MSKPLEEETQWPTVDKESRRRQRRWDLLHSSGPQAQEPNRKRRVDAGEATSGTLSQAQSLR